jgi:hypothetical protein
MKPTKICVSLAGWAPFPELSETADDAHHPILVGGSGALRSRREVARKGIEETVVEELDHE